MQIQKTVFISYRRTNIYTALAIYQNLKSNGYDAFFDYQSIDAGDWEQVILRQIAARAHFIVLLTPSALERCNEPGDMLRREIEEALDLQRNIVPLMFETFDFGKVEKQLTGKLSLLSKYNGLRIVPDYFDAGMDRLRNRFLNIPLELVVHPTPIADEGAIQIQQTTAEQQPDVTEAQLTAEEYFEISLKQLKAGDYESAISGLTKAIQLKPDYIGAFGNRGIALTQKGDWAGAIADYDEVIRLNPKDTIAYYNRGIARMWQGDLDGAIADCDEVIRIQPDDVQTHSNRGEIHFIKKTYTSALDDFERAHSLNSTLTYALAGLAITHHALGDVEKAIDFWEMLLTQDSRYTDPDWAGKEFGWHESLVAEARKLVAKLGKD